MDERALNASISGLKTTMNYLSRLERGGYVTAEAIAPVAALAHDLQVLRGDQVGGE